MFPIRIWPNSRPEARFTGLSHDLTRGLRDSGRLTPGQVAHTSGPAGRRGGVDFDSRITVTVGIDVHFLGFLGDVACMWL